jgi:tetratricopeptide (TPR) repeat protein
MFMRFQGRRLDKVTLALLLPLMGSRLSSLSAQHGPHGPENGLNTPPNAQGQIAPRLQNLGSHTFRIKTRSRRAQEFFNQGINLSYGFNHAEAMRAFREVARLDPKCAIAYWGQALVLGPNINMPMLPEAEPEAHKLIQKAVELKPHASSKERDYIDALAKRYSGDAKPDRKALDQAYANAMKNLAKKYPDDLDAATLYVEALMDLRPWNYWTRDGVPYADTPEIISLLESVMKRNPNHPGACHFYIHAVEATKSPERAEAAADRLFKLMPGAGHMVHMPSHIYFRVGRYADASKANSQASAVDEEYIAQCKTQGIYPLVYYPHNLHFLYSAASFEGNSELAILAAEKVAAAIPHHALRDFPMLQGFLAIPELALARFGRWEQILNLPAPAHDTLFLKGIRQYVRGTALAATGRLDEASRELEALKGVLADKALDETPASFSNNSARAILGIAPEVLAGEILARQSKFPEAIAHLETATRLEDALVYIEPPDWYLPTRQALGAVLLQAGRAAEAEAVYWEDLRRYPHNGWSLFGLAQSLRSQGKNEEAAMAEQRFQKAWAQANVTLSASRF